MKRGVLLLMVGVTAAGWLLAPAPPASSETASPAAAVQRTSTTLAVVTTTVPETIPESAPVTVAVTEAPAAPTTVAAADATTRDDPAATRLRRITYALIGLGGLVLAFNLVFWKVTRPAPLLPPRAEQPAPATTANVAAATPRAVAPVAPVVASVAVAPAKISASAFLATPAVAPAVAVGLPPMVPVVPEHEPGEEPPPVGAPAIDAPAPLAGIPLGAPKPLVGTDSAWIIEPESGSGLIPDTPTAVDFPEAVLPEAAAAGLSEAAASSAPAPADPIDVSSTDASPSRPEPEIGPEPATTYPAATQALISALSAIPDKEPTLVRFDDPPVERVARRRAEPAPAPERTADDAVAPTGAPGFDRIARQATAVSAAIPERQVDDMALMASALSSLPVRRPPEIDDPDLPPVGEFYDQDLDEGDPPGRN